MTVFCLESRIGIIVVIPGYDRCVRASVTSSVKVDTDRIVLEYLITCYLRSDIIAVLIVFQIIELVRFSVISGVFGEIPKSRIDLASDPFDVVACIVARDQSSVVIYHKEFISFL